MIWALYKCGAALEFSRRGVERTRERVRERERERERKRERERGEPQRPKVVALSPMQAAGHNFDKDVIDKRTSVSGGTYMLGIQNALACGGTGSA